MIYSVRPLFRLVIYSVRPLFRLRVIYSVRPLFRLCPRSVRLGPADWGQRPAGSTPATPVQKEHAKEKPSRGDKLPEAGRPDDDQAHPSFKKAAREIFETGRKNRGDAASGRLTACCI